MRSDGTNLSLINARTDGLVFAKSETDQMEEHGKDPGKSTDHHILVP